LTEAAGASLDFFLRSATFGLTGSGLTTEVAFGGALVSSFLSATTFTSSTFF
jgi:hypothetical protein